MLYKRHALHQRLRCCVCEVEERDKRGPHMETLAGLPSPPHSPIFAKRLVVVPNKMSPPTLAPRPRCIFAAFSFSCFL